MSEATEAVEDYAEEHEIGVSEAWDHLALYALRRLAALDKDRDKNAKTRKIRKKKARGTRHGALGYARKAPK